MEIGRLFTDEVAVGSRHRPLNDTKVAALAESMNCLGLMQPISVWCPDNTVAHLIAGHHRLAAARKLGWDQIDVFFVNMDETDRELWEIDENLMRAELSPAQVAAQLARRKEIWEVRKTGATDCRGSLSDGRKAGPQHDAGFAKDTEAKAGVDKRTIQRATARAAALGDSLSDVAGTSLDKGVELDALAKLDADTRRDLIARAKAGENVSARKPVPVTSADDALNDFEATQKQVNALVAAWNKAGREAREQFREYIDTAVFDRTEAGR